MVQTGLQRRPAGALRFWLLGSLLVTPLAGSAAPPTARPQLEKSEPLPSEPIAIAKLSFSGMAEEVSSDLRSSLATTVQRGGYSVRSPQEVDSLLGSELRLLGCTTASCYGRLAQLLGVRRVIEGEVQRLELSTFSLRLQMRDLFSGQSTTPIQERCDVCSTDDVRQMVVRAAERLTKEVPPRGPQMTEPRIGESGILIVETEPPGATVTIDGAQRSEKTPASYLLAAGVHSLVVQDDKHRRVRQQVEVAPGSQPMTLRLSLSAQNARRSWMTGLGIAATVGAVGLIAGGAALLYKHNSPVFTAECPDLGLSDYHCPSKYDNLAPGVGMLVGGGVLAITGGVLLYLDSRPTKAKPVVEKQ